MSKKNPLLIEAKQPIQVLGRTDGGANALRIAQASQAAKVRASRTLPPHHKEHIQSHYGFDFPYRIEDLASLTDGRLAEAMAHPDFPLDDCPIELWPRIIRFMKKAHEGHWLEGAMQAADTYNPLRLYVDLEDEKALTTSKGITAADIAKIHAGEIRFKQPQTAINAALKVRPVGNVEVYFESGPADAPYVYERFTIYAIVSGQWAFQADPNSPNTTQDTKVHTGTVFLNPYTNASFAGFAFHEYNQGSFIQDKHVNLWLDFFCYCSAWNCDFIIDAPEVNDRKYRAAIQQAHYSHVNANKCNLIGTVDNPAKQIALSYMHSHAEFNMSGAWLFKNIKLNKLFDAHYNSFISYDAVPTVEDFSLDYQYHLEGNTTLKLISGVSSLPTPTVADYQNVALSDSVVY